jgi:hypothetical protein
MVSNSRRFDPYKAFKFRVLAAAALAGIAAFGIVKRLGTSASKRRKGHARPRPIEEVDTGARPIEAVGTSTAGFVGTAPEQPRPTPSRTRKSPRKTKAAGS